MTTTAVERAVASLGAILVGHHRYAYLNSVGDRKVWFTCDLDRGNITKQAEMPAWWSPEQRFAWRVFNGKASAAYGPWTEATLAKRFATEADLFAEINASDGDYERITANVETGEEVRDESPRLRPSSPSL